MDINTQMRLTGLATGLDTDEVIRNMGRVHNLRIDAVNRERQLAVWRQEMYRETISMLSGFQRSHLNLSNPSNNFRSPSAFAKFSFNLSLGGSAEAAARIMSVSANGDLRNFNQSVQAVAQLATKDTFNGSERGLQGINSSGFDFENFLTRTPKISDPAERAAKLDSFVNNALRDGLDFDGWGKDRATFISFMDGLDNDWHLDKFASAFETFFKDDGNFEDWLVSNPGGDWNGFLADPANAAIIDEALDEFKTDRAAAIKDLAWSQYQTDNSAAINDDWNDFLESPAYATAVSDIRAAATAKFNSDNADNVTFRYVMFGVSIDGVSRTVTLTNTELEEIYKEGDTPQQKAQAFADLVNSKLGNLFGKDFNNMVSVHSGELRVHKAGSSITLFAETGFESSLRNMGFTTGANNRNFGNKTVGELFPSMFGQAMRGTGASATPTYQFDNNGHPLFKGADGYVVDGSNRQVFVDGNDNLLFRSSDGNFIDRNNRQVFVDNNDNLIFRNSNGTFVDADNRTVTGSGFEPLRTAINSNPDLAARLDNGKVKPLVNDNTVIHINNTAITISSSDSVAEMMAKVNSSSAGVDLTYDAAGDRFVLTSRQEGSANSIDMVPLSSSTTLNATGNFLTAIGILQEKDGGGFEYAERQEAKNLRAIINGQEVTRFSNTFMMDGMTYTFNETFNSTITSENSYLRGVGAPTASGGGYVDEEGRAVNAEGYRIDDDGNRIVDVAKGTIQVTNPSDQIRIQVNKNTDDLISSIRDFIDEYNKLIDHANKLMNERRDRDYPPLTDDQKKAMSAEEVKAWEEKAKAGLLGGDMDLRRLIDQMRRAVFMPVEGAGISMAEIGITTSANWKEGGRLSIDESKLREAIEGNYDNVVRLFTKSSDIPYGSGDQARRFNENGFANRLNDIMSDAVRTTTIDGRKGYFVEKAGVVNDSTALSNPITRQIQQFDQRISVLLDRWKRQEQSYYQMFARMETAMMRLQTQQNNLASLMAQTGN